jgi:hypothetical protein
MIAAASLAVFATILMGSVRLSADERAPPATQPSTANAVMVMMGHLYHPTFSDGANVPASLSGRGISSSIPM